MQKIKTAYQKYIAVTGVEKKFKQDSTTRAIKNNADSTKVAADPVALKAIRLKIKLSDSLAKKKDTLTSKQAEEKEAWKGLVKNLKYDSAKSAAQNKTMRGSYSKIWSSQNPRIQRAESYGLYSIGVWNIGSMMLWGMALLGVGFFSGRLSAAKHLVIGLLLVAAGLILAYFRLCDTHSRIIDYAKFVQDHAIPYNQFLPLEQLLMATGYASLIMWWVLLGVLGWTGQLLAAVGRMALTNYILQTWSALSGSMAMGWVSGAGFNRPESILLHLNIIGTGRFFCFLVTRLPHGAIGMVAAELVYRKWQPMKKESTDHL